MSLVPTSPEKPMRVVCLLQACGLLCLQNHSKSNSIHATHKMNQETELLLRTSRNTIQVSQSTFQALTYSLLTLPNTDPQKAAPHVLHRGRSLRPQSSTGAPVGSRRLRRGDLRRGARRRCCARILRPRTARWRRKPEATDANDLRLLFPFVVSFLC